MQPDHLKLDEDLCEALECITRIFHQRSIRYALIGGMGAVLRGRVRFTSDVDFVLDVPQLSLPGLLEDLIRHGFAFDPVLIIREYVQQHITAIAFGKIRVDWLKPVLPLYARVLRDASIVHWSDTHDVRVATSEGLILTKMLAFRSRDQEDIETLLIANREEIDLSIIREEWAPFAPAEADRTAWLDAAIAKHVTPFRAG